MFLKQPRTLQPSVVAAQRFLGDRAVLSVTRETPFANPHGSQGRWPGRTNRLLWDNPARHAVAQVPSPPPAPPPPVAAATVTSTRSENQLSCPVVVDEGRGIVAFRSVLGIDGRDQHGI